MKKEWEKLTPYAQIRQRAEMYFGSRDPHTQQVLEYTEEGPRIVETTWVPAVFTCFREIVDNSLDECVTHGHGNRIDVTYDPKTMTISVTDNGRGMPIEWSKEHNAYAATVLLSEIMSGRNFVDDRGETRGLNGIGAKGVNFCSEWFQVEVVRGKMQFGQRFSEGAQLKIGEANVWPTNEKKTGTSIRFKLSKKVFPNLTLPESFIAARMHEIALCYPKLHLTYNGRKIETKNTSLFGKHEPILFDINEEGFRAKFWLVPNFIPEDDFAFSLVNAIPLFNNGAHMDAFRRGFYTGLLSAMERESRKRKLVPNRADVSEGLLIYSIMEMNSPSFDSQAKTRLINEQVGSMVRKTLDAPEFYRDIIRKYPAWIESIYERCAKRTQAKDERDTAKQAKKNLRQKIEDLEDACGHDRSQCVLFITEGKSAVVGCAEARDPQIHGAIPLRGKILNVHGVANKKIIENEALSKLMGAIGLVPGQRANRHSLRYGRLMVTCDADEDGKSITALLISFFYNCWPELFDPQKPPFLYVFSTPLIIAAKGKQRRYWYNDDVHTFNPERYKGWEITRAKGLAALEKEDWKHALANPKATPIVDDGGLKDALTLIFSPDADARKSWIGL